MHAKYEAKSQLLNSVDFIMKFKQVAARINHLISSLLLVTAVNKHELPSEGMLKDIEQLTEMTPVSCNRTVSIKQLVGYTMSPKVTFISRKRFNVHKLVS